ncbi:MAG TPA: zf-HC2 domain-containing protein [Thermoanaerobaculia bacterium]
MNDEELDRHVRAIAAQLGEDEHPDLETELFAYAEGTLPRDRTARVTAHLQDCARCREDVADARALATAAPRRAARAWVPLAAAALLAALALLFLVTRDDPAPAPAAPVRPRIAEPRRPPEERRYARAEWEALVRDARAGAPMPMPRALASLQQPPAVLRGPDGGEAGSLAPAGIVIETRRPQFRWPAREGAHAIVTVFDGEREVARSGERTGSRWTIDRDLPRGVVYTWQVELDRGGAIAILPEPPAPPAQFRVLDAAAAQELDAARREDDPLLLGLLYARAGLADEARAELARVTRAEDAAAARRIRDEIAAWRP